MEGGEKEISGKLSENKFIIILEEHFQCILNRIGGVTVNVLVSSAVNREFGRRSGQTTDYESDIFCTFSRSAQHEGVRIKTAWYGMSIMCPSGVTYSTSGLLFQGPRTIYIQVSVLV